MKVAVLNTSVPFLKGGAEFLADGLVRELEARGHDVEMVKVPLRWATPLDVAETMFAAASLRIPEADRVIALKFPAYLVPHPNKVLWLMHQFRQVYDFWGTDLQDVPNTPEGKALRRAVRVADERAFSDARAIFCNSAVTAERLQRYNGVGSEVLLAPHDDASIFRAGPQGDYLLAIGRVNAAKRQYLLVDALAQLGGDLRLVIAGKPETPGDLAMVQDRIDRHGLADRVEFLPRFISDEEKAELLAGSFAVAYLPVDEDSYGYVTAEGMYSSRPVVTTTDSGGVLELVVDGVTGVVGEPTAESLAAAIGRLASDPENAAAMGQAANQAVHRLGLNWDRTIERLLA